MTRRPPRNALLGVVGTLTAVLLILASMNYDHLPLLRNTNTITANFGDAAGLRPGDDVRVSGASVGTVTDVRVRDGLAQVTMALDSGAPALGSTTRADVVTVTLLGKMAVQLDPQGPGQLAHGAMIPRSRTTTPYNINDALGRLTDKTATIDKQQLSAALAQVAEGFAGTPTEIRGALHGVEELSHAVADNDQQLQSLLGRARNVSGVLAAHDTQIAELLTNGRSLLTELDNRQQVVVSLLHSARSLADQLRAVVEENTKVIGPSLSQLDKVIGLLNRNRDSLQQSITGLRNYATAFNEAISTGPFFDAYVQNLTSPSSLAPIISGALK